MDFVSTSLITLTQPSGFWESILNAFRGANGTYILAVILLAIIVRVVFSLFDIVNKKVNMKTTDINAKMKPELEAIQKKYGGDQRLLQQKTNEIYKKYQFSMMGSCLPMLVMMILQMVVFFTLWASLQSVANFNIVSQYENMKETYANVIVLNENETFINRLSEFEDVNTAKLSIDVETDKDGKKFLVYKFEEDSEATKIEFKEFKTNNEIYDVLKKFVIKPATPDQPNPDESNPEGAESADETVTQPEVVYEDTHYNEFIKILAENTAKDYYFETQEGFLWIKNVYKADSPTTSPLFTKDEIKGYLKSFYSEDESKIEEKNDFEGKIFDFVVKGFETEDMGVNGYYILTILAVVFSFLSLFLSNKLMQSKDAQQQKQSKMMYFIMPIIFGIFTFMYTSLFAVYLIVGQLVVMATTPLTTLIVKKWLSADKKKQKESDVIEVDYRRK